MCPTPVQILRTFMRNLSKLYILAYINPQQCKSRSGEGWVLTHQSKSTHQTSQTSIKVDTDPATLQIANCVFSRGSPRSLERVKEYESTFYQRGIYSGKSSYPSPPLSIKVRKLSSIPNSVSITVPHQLIFLYQY